MDSRQTPLPIHFGNQAPRCLLPLNSLGYPSAALADAPSLEAALLCLDRNDDPP